MDKELISKALYSALSLIEEEFETVEFDDLKEQYLETIELLKNAIENLESKE